MNRFTNKQLLMSCFILLVIQFFTFSFISSVILQIIIVFLTKTVATMAFVYDQFKKSFQQLLIMPDKIVRYHLFLPVKVFHRFYFRCQQDI